MTALLGELKRIIAVEGPISVERYMALCLGHPIHGYYTTRDPFGAAGDFTTAPEISQMFGELIGLWAAEVWRLMGSPRPLALIELGPGRGTLLSDLVRATRIVPGLHEALALHLVETSPALRARQQETLAAAPVPAFWHRTFAKVPTGPAIVIANEFFDALPIRQFVRGEDGWRERLIGVGKDERLVFGLAAEPEPQLPPGGAVGDVLEWPVGALRLIDEVAERVVAQGGAALIIDYGHVGPALGDTMQAVQRHAFTDPLANPGDADLTAHVDFAKLAAQARARGAAVHGPVSQRAFLTALGIETRAQALGRAGPGRSAEVAAALQRLTGEGPSEMGALFKVMALADPALRDLPALPRSRIVRAEPAC